jgi:phosphohistidine phosphatase
MNPMRIYLMRHGEALPVGGAITEDAQRPLSPQGSEQVLRVAKNFKKMSHPLSVVMCSPLRRAQETARVFSRVLGLDPVQVSSALAPHASPAGLVTLAQATPDASGLLWVGHHPDVTLWIAFMTGLDASVCPLFGTASLAALDFDPQQKKAELLWFQP